MQQRAVYDDVVARRASRARASGSTPRSRPASTPGTDRPRPGLGFAKTAEHNWALLARLDELVRRSAAGAGRRLAASVPRRAAGRRRRRAAPGRPATTPRAAVTALAAAAGAWGVRVHEVPAQRRRRPGRRRLARQARREHEGCASTRATAEPIVERPSTAAQPGVLRRVRDRRPRRDGGALARRPGRARRSPASIPGSAPCTAAARCCGPCARSWRARRTSSSSSPTCGSP